MQPASEANGSVQTAGPRELGTAPLRQAAAPSARPAADPLHDILRRLDDRLAAAAAAVRRKQSMPSPADSFRGLFVDDDDAARLLDQSPLEPPLLERGRAHLVEVASAPSFARLAEAYELDAFDLDAIAVALAPELDLRYERLYGYLQDDVTRKRPTVDLVLDLLCGSGADKVARRTRFAPDAPLVHHMLVRIAADPSHVEPPLLAHFVKVDEQVLNLVLGQDAADPRLAAFCRLAAPESDGQLAADGATLDALARLVMEARRAGRALVVHLQGPRGTGKRASAEHVAGRCGARLLVVDLASALVQERPFEDLVPLVLREAQLRSAIPYLEGLDALLADDRRRELEALESALDSSGTPALLAGERPWAAGGTGLTATVLRFGVPSFLQARARWQSAVAGIGVHADDALLNELAGRFRLTPRQIDSAVVAARDAASLRSLEDGEGDGGPPAGADLFAGARAQSGQGLAALARRVEPLYSWDDIVLPQDALAQLRELCSRVVLRHRVLDDWGFKRRLSLGTAASALFAGPSGTGKTMAAEIIAREVGLDLFKINLSAVVSKYIGETEKNLDRIFRVAETANAILLFDEAEALFGKRSEVRDSHDRYANIEIAYLLQKMEEYEGVAILATNLRQNVDESFLRRLAFTIHFPFPDEADRRRIWSGIWPSQTPRSNDVDLDLLAREYRLAGGNIKNIALAAAFLAAAEGSPVTMSHVLLATRREYQKLGKALAFDEPGGRHAAAG